MPYDLGSSVNAAAEWVYKAPLVRGVVTNPVFTALLLTSLMVVILLSLYRDALTAGGTKLAVRAVLYGFLSALAVFFIHHYAVTAIAQEDCRQQGIREAFGSIEAARIGAEPGWGMPAPAMPAPAMPAPAPAVPATVGGTGGTAGYGYQAAAPGYPVAAPGYPVAAPPAANYTTPGAWRPPAPAGGLPADWGQRLGIQDVVLPTAPVAPRGASATVV